MGKGGYFTIIASLPAILSTEATLDYVNTQENLDELRRDFGLKPYKEKRGSVQYLRSEIDAAINRARMKRDEDDARNDKAM